MEPAIDIAFDCLPLRSVNRMDVPLDASEQYRERVEKLKSAFEQHGAERTYYLYNARCVYRFANSEIEGMVRFDFAGVIRTDLSDLLTEHVQLDVQLSSETCGGVPAVVQDWLRERVCRAVAIEFDRFIAAGSLSQCADKIGQLEQLSDLAGFAGMNV